MPGVMAILSKAFFEKELRVGGRVPRVGDLVAVDRYLSKHKRLEPLAGGGALFLVTVRPPDEQLLLVAVLERPAFEGEQWRASRPNTVPVLDISGLRGELRFEGGKGITMERGKLAMALQTPRVLDEADEALLRRVAGGGTPAPAPAPTSPPTKTEEKTKTKERKARRGAATPARTGDPAALLAQAIEAFDELPRCFEALRACWEVTRWPRLAGIVETLTAARESEAAAELRAAGGKNVPQKRWLEAEARLEPPDRGALCATLARGTIREVGERIDRLAAWPDDPRLAGALVALVAEVPWVSSGSRTTWTRVYRRLAALPDPRLLEVARRFDSSVLPTGWQGARDFFDEHLAALRGKVEAALEERGVREPTAAEAGLLGQLEARIGAGAAAPSRASDPQAVEAQLALVLERPDDDEGYLVLADLLLQRGDVRGELIQLQHLERAGALDRDQRARMKAILKEHHPALLGPLEPLVLKKGLGLKRGFVSSCVIKEKCDARDLAAAEGHPLLGFIRELEAPLAFALQPGLRNLRYLVLPPREPLELLAACPRPLPIEALGCFLDQDGSGDVVGKLGCVPALRSVTLISSSNDEMGRVLGGPLARRLERLCIDSRPYWSRRSIGSGEVGGWLRRIEERRDLQLLELSFLHDRYHYGSTIGRPTPECEVEARRPAGGRFNELRIAFLPNPYRPDAERDVAAALDSLDRSTIRRLTIKARRKTQAGDLVREAVERLQGLEEVELSI